MLRCWDHERNFFYCWMFSKRILLVFDKNLKLSTCLEANSWRKQNSELPLPMKRVWLFFLMCLLRVFIQNTSSLLPIQIGYFLICQKYPPPPRSLPSLYPLAMTFSTKPLTPVYFQIPCLPCFRDLDHLNCTKSIFGWYNLFPERFLWMLAQMFLGVFGTSPLFWRCLHRVETQ